MVLTYDYPYNKRIANTLIENSKTWEPVDMQPDRLIGGSMQFRKSANVEPSAYVGVPAPDTFIQPGITPSYPQYNVVELKKINQKQLNKSGVPLQGGSISKYDLAQLVGMLPSEYQAELLKILQGSLNGKLEGGFNFRDLGRKLMSFGRAIRPIVTPLLDAAVPVVGTALGSRIGNVGLGNMIASTARDGIRAITGAGAKKPRKAKKAAGVGIYEQQASVSPVSCKQGKREMRNQLVKKIMQDQKLSLPAASKYIKVNKLM